MKSVDDFKVKLDERFPVGWFYLTCPGLTIDDVVGDAEPTLSVLATSTGLECFSTPGAELRVTTNRTHAEGLTESGRFELGCASAFLASTSDEPILTITLDRPSAGQIFTNQTSEEDRPSKVVVLLPELQNIEETMKRPWFRRVFG